MSGPWRDGNADSDPNIPENGLDSSCERIESRVPWTYFIDVRGMDEWNVYKLEKVFDLSNQLIGALPFPYSRLRSSPSDIGQICCQTIHVLETLINFTTRLLDSHKHHIDIRQVPIATLSSGIPTTGFFYMPICVYMTWPIWNWEIKF